MSRRYLVVDGFDVPIERSTSSKAKAVKVAKATGTARNPSCLYVQYAASAQGPFQTKRLNECYVGGKRVKRTKRKGR